MAQPIPCDLCNDPDADLLVSNRHNGDTLGLCLACVPAWAEAVTVTLNTLAEAEAAQAEPAAEPHPTPPPAAKKAPRARTGRSGPVALPDLPADASDAEWEASAGGPAPQ